MIIVAGEALVDLIIRTDGTVEAALGGAPFNTARAAGRLGSDVEYLGTLSLDRFGMMLAEQLAADGVGTRWTHRSERPTTLAAAELDHTGAATYRFYVEGTSIGNSSQAVAPNQLLAPLVFVGGGGNYCFIYESWVNTLHARSRKKSSGGSWQSWGSWTSYAPQAWDDGDFFELENNGVTPTYIREWEFYFTAAGWTNSATITQG